MQAGAGYVVGDAEFSRSGLADTLIQDRGDNGGSCFSGAH
jgi:hypothetical protein